MALLLLGTVDARNALSVTASHATIQRASMDHTADVIGRFCGQWAYCCPGRGGITHGPKTLIHSAAAAVSAGCSSYASRCCPKSTPMLGIQKQLSVSFSHIMTSSILKVVLRLTWPFVAGSPAVKC